jgi:ankyrin repeat protein
VENIRFEAIQQHHLLQVRNDLTRTCLDLAAMLGHHESVKLLAEKGTTMMTNGINLSNGMGK